MSRDGAVRVAPGAPSLGDRGRRGGYASLAGLALAGVVLAGPLAGQAPERAGFILLRGNDTLAVERFERSPTVLEGTLIERVQGMRVAYRLALAPDARVHSVTARVWRAGAPDTAAPAQEASAVFHGDSVTMRASGPNAGPEQTIAAPGALPYINLSAALLEQFVKRARSAGLTSVPMLLGNGTVTNVGISWLGADSATLAVAGVQFWLALDPAGRILSASVPAQGLRFVRVADVGLSLNAMHRARPDYSAPAGAPYGAEEVVVAGPAGKLAGTLTVPRARRGRVPAVVTITGSGGQERDEAIPLGSHSAL